MPPPRSAYIHVPFCRHRCGYCNFTLVAGRDDLIGDYLRAIELELASTGDAARGRHALLRRRHADASRAASNSGELGETVLHWHPLAAGYEWTVEANPADVDEPMIDDAPRARRHAAEPRRAVVPRREAAAVGTRPLGRRHRPGRRARPRRRPARRARSHFRHARRNARPMARRRRRRDRPRARSRFHLRPHVRARHRVLEPPAARRTRSRPTKNWNATCTPP